MSSEYPVPKQTADGFQQLFKKIQPATVQGGPVAFAILFTIKGGGRPVTQESNPMPIPQEWRDAAKQENKPLLVPEGFLAFC